MPNNQKLTAYISKMHVLAQITIDKLSREIEHLKIDLNRKNAQVNTLRSKIDQISDILNIPDPLNSKNLIEKLKTKIEHQEEIIQTLKLQEDSSALIEDYSVIELFKHPHIIQKIQQIDELVPYAEEHIWSIITILIEKQDLSLSEITSLNKLAKSSNSRIVSKLRKQKIVKMRKIGRTPVYSLNLSYLKTLINNHIQQQKIEQLSKQIRGK